MGWVFAVFVLALLVIAIVVLAVFLSGVSKPQDHPIKENRPNARSITLRRQPETLPKRRLEEKQFTHGDSPLTFNRKRRGGISNIRKEFNLDVICRRNGKSKRVCTCERCKQERLRFGS